MITRLSQYRVALGWVVALAAVYLAAPTPQSLSIGIPIALVGLLIRGVAAGTIRKGSALAQTGIYALTRNPLYLGSSLLALAFGIMSGTLASGALLVILSAGVYPPIIRNEEAELRHSFGSRFDDYREAVPCFVPRRLNANVLEPFSFRQFLTNREYNATIGFLVATGVLAAKYLLRAA